MTMHSSNFYERQIQERRNKLIPRKRLLLINRLLSLKLDEEQPLDSILTIFSNNLCWISTEPVLRTPWPGLTSSWNRIYSHYEKSIESMKEDLYWIIYPVTASRRSQKKENIRINSENARKCGTNQLASFPLIRRVFPPSMLPLLQLESSIAAHIQVASITSVIVLEHWTRFQGRQWPSAIAAEML